MVKDQQTGCGLHSSVVVVCNKNIFVLVYIYIYYISLNRLCTYYSRVLLQACLNIASKRIIVAVVLTSLVLLSLWHSIFLPHWLPPAQASNNGYLHFLSYLYLLWCCRLKGVDRSRPRSNEVCGLRSLFKSAHCCTWASNWGVVYSRVQLLHLS